MQESSRIRILVVDDSEAIHADFIKVLTPKTLADYSLDATRKAIFGDYNQEVRNNTIAESPYLIDSAYQGEEALKLVKKSMEDKKPYALAFVDIRMPPGWDGVKTIEKIWEVDPDLQCVICTAYTDYSWNDMSEKLHHSDNFLILKKPFDLIEIRQLASALTKKWEMSQQIKKKVHDLQGLVKKRTMDLERSLSLTKTTLEATQEGIITIGQDKEIINYNTVFLKLWNLTEEDIQEKDTVLVIKKLAEQVDDPDVLYDTFLKPPAHLKGGKIQEWQLKSGKILELYSHPQYLNDVIIGTVFNVLDITERQNYENQLIHQSTYDSLTELPNRFLLTDRIKQAISFAKRRELFVGVLFLDLDNFKQVNDSLGHASGDKLLKICGEKIKACLRESDTVARWGGDEFVIIFTPIAKEEALTLKANELIHAFTSLSVVDQHRFNITASIGISIYPKDGHDADTLLKNADAALYRAKESGRNKIQYYSAEFNEKVLQHSELSSALSVALDNHEFSLLYQPLIELNTGKIIGAEALCRWEHETLGSVSPDVFIKIAEESGLIIQIGEWVLKAACAQAKKWHDLLSAPLKLAVNISPYQFQQSNFVEIVSGIIQSTGIKAEALELEITENLLIGNPSIASEKMAQLKALGVLLSMDDFGVGYASLSYIKYFPFDKVKIDKSFISGIATNNDDQVIVEAMIAMTKTMELQVLAEGVENEAQIAFLKKHQCNQVQGFYYSPPVNVDEFTQLLLASHQK